MYTSDMVKKESKPFCSLFLDWTAYPEPDPEGGSRGSVEIHSPTWTRNLIFIGNFGYIFLETVFTINIRTTLYITLLKFQQFHFAVRESV